MINRSADEYCHVVAFGEALLPGYPFWLSLTHGSKFNSEVQKNIHAHYMQQAVQIESGHLDAICEAAKKRKIAIYLGIVERPKDRGGHSLYCSLVFINRQGKIQSVHRKLQPTYEERLTWSPGDGHGLVIHEMDEFCLGGLNCWENWMPLARTALYAQGENVHFAVWPGATRNTEAITRFISKESRSFVISVSGLMRRTDFPENTPHLELILAECPATLADGGSCIAHPDGSWVLPPQIGQEDLYVEDLDLESIYKERQNFDVSGHYARPDITKLMIDKRRNGVLGEREE